MSYFSVRKHVCATDASLKSRAMRRRIYRYTFILYLGLMGCGAGLIYGQEAASAEDADLAEPESLPLQAEALPESQPTHLMSLRINLAAARLDLYIDGGFSKSYRVAIGMPRYPTPIRSFNISKIIWNPWWLPPDSPWAKGEKKTPPGPKNPLGPVKMIMEDGVRIHGTSAPASIGRAASHACLRMKSAEAVELAWLIQQAYSDKNDPALLDDYNKQSRKSFYVTLFQEVPVEVEYKQIEQQGDVLWVHPDPYGRGGLKKELEEMLSSYPEIVFDKALLRQFDQMRRKGSFEVSINELRKAASESAAAK